MNNLCFISVHADRFLAGEESGEGQRGLRDVLHPVELGAGHSVAHSNHSFVVGGTSTIGAAGDRLNPAFGRANYSSDRDHWAFDRAAYRREQYLLLLAPAQYGAAAMVALSLLSFCLLLVSAVWH